MGELGEFLGFMIIVCYAMTILNYFVKFINRKYRDTLKKNENFYKVYTKVMKFIIKSHKLFGFLTIAFILFHFYIQFTRIELSITGVIAAGIMLLQVLLGVYGWKVKKKGRTWLYVHRSIAAVLLITILIHIL
jgi:hypothetical protein